MRLHPRIRFASVLALSGATLALGGGAHSASADFVKNPDGSVTDTFDAYQGGTQNTPSTTNNSNYYDIFNSSFVSGAAGTYHGGSFNIQPDGHNANGVVAAAPFAPQTVGGIAFSTTDPYFGLSGVNYETPGALDSTTNGVAGGTSYYYDSTTTSTVSTADSGPNSMQSFFQLEQNNTTALTSGGDVIGSYSTTYQGKSLTKPAIAFQQVTSTGPNSLPNTNQGLEDGQPIVDLGGAVSFDIYVDAGVPSTIGTKAAVNEYGTQEAAGSAPIAVELGLNEVAGQTSSTPGLTLGGTSNATTYDIFEDQGTTATGGGSAGSTGTLGSTEYSPLGGYYVPNGSWVHVTFNFATDTQAFAYDNAGDTSGTSDQAAGFFGSIENLGFTALYNSASGVRPTYSIYIDNFTIIPAASGAASAPEPSAWSLMGIGGIVFAGARAARQRAGGRRRGTRS